MTASTICIKKGRNTWRDKPPGYCGLKKRCCISRTSHRNDQLIAFLVPSDNDVPQGHTQGDQPKGTAVAHNIGHINILAQITGLLKPDHGDGIGSVNTTVMVSAVSMAS